MTKFASIGNYTRKEGGRFVKFLLVGAIGFVVDAIVFTLFAQILHVPALSAQAVSFTAAVISNFIWNRYWTYPESRSKRIRWQLAQFSLVNLAGLAIRTVVFAAVHGPLLSMAAGQPWLPIDASLVSDYVALACAVGIVMLWNFFVNRYWTYNDVN